MRRLLKTCVLVVATIFFYQLALNSASADALTCPGGYYKVSDRDFCCEDDSTYDRQGLENRCFFPTSGSSRVCSFDRGSSGAELEETDACGIDHINSGGYCSNGQLYIGAGLERGEKDCLSPSTPIPDGYPQRIANMVFLGCTTLTTNPGKIGAFSGVITMPYCIELEAILVTDQDYEDNVCVCDDNSRPVVSDPTACDSECGGIDKVVLGGTNTSSTNSPQAICGQLDGSAAQQCLDCIDSQGIYTALGCINITQSGFTIWFIRFALGLIIVVAVFRFIQASLLIRKADPESVQEGRDIVISAIIALVLALLAVPLLEFIGVKVLGIVPDGFFQSQ